MTLQSTTRVYSGRVFDVDLDTVEFPNGTVGTLEMIRHPGAAAVLPLIDPISDADPRVALIHQFRHAANDYIWEVPAGRLEPREQPAECARREMAEETGYEAGALEWLARIYTTPGFTDEVIHLFAAAVSGKRDHEREPDEFLEVRVLRWSDVGRMVARGEILDGKTLCCLQAFERRRRGGEPGAGW